ncbi:MAG TPA: cadmium-containing carbonic anhydrase [Candidatus Saccharimonadales bacterium]
MQQTRIVHIGRLSNMVWRGNVSATDTFVDVPAIIETLNEYYVSVNPKAKTRCIDGRHDPNLDEAELGPQVPGGATGAALAYRLGVDRDDLTRGTFLSDFESMLDNYLRLGLSPGGHRDNAEHQDGKVGCGAIDGVASILACLSDTQLVEDSKRLTRAILAEDFVRDDYLRVLGASVVLEAHADDYFAQNSELLPLLEERAPGSVSTLTGIHNEKIVIVNFVPDTTFSSNRFADSHDGMQAFGYDVWRSKELATMLLPQDSQYMDRWRFVTARVMITIATLMALTDGSLQVLFRLPVEEE